MAEKGEFWGKDGKQEQAEKGGEFWGEASKKAEEERRAAKRAAAGLPPVTKKKASLAKKLVLGGLGVGTLAVVVAVALLPKIAGAIAPGIIEREAGKSIKGSVKVEGVSLTWTGPQGVGPVRVLDANGSVVAELNARATVGLLDLIGGLGDVGSVNLSGKANLTRYADGTTTIDRLMPPAKAGEGKPAEPAAKPGEPTKLPAGLKARVVVDALDVTVRDEVLAAQTGGRVTGVEVKGLKADTTLRVGGVTQLDLNAQASTTGDGGRVTPGGALVIQGRLTDWTNAEGALTLNKATIEATAEAKDLSMAVVDALGGMAGKLVAGVGDRLNAKVVLKGGLNAGEFDVSADGPNVKAALAGAIADGVLSTRGPGSVRIASAGVSAFKPEIDAALGGNGAITGFPDVTATISSLKLRLPKDGVTDLRGSSLAVKIETTPTQGTIVIDPKASPRELRLEPLIAELSAPDLAGPVRVTAKTSAAVGGSPAGSLDADVTAAGLLDAKGAPAGGLPASINGSIALTGVATALAAPFVASTGLDLPADIGPELNLALRAATSGEARAGSIPPTTLTLSASSAHLKADGAFQVSDAAVRTSGEGLTLSLATAGAIAARMMPADSGVALGGGSGALTAKITGLSLPLDEQRRPKIGRAEGRADVSLGAMTLALTDKTSGRVERIEIGQLTAGAALRGSEPPRAEVNAGMSYEGKPFTARGGFDLPGLFGGPDGAPTPERVRPLGKLEIVGAPTALARLAGGGGQGPDLAGVIAEVVGATADIALTSQPSKQVDGGIDAGVAITSNGLNVNASADVGATSLALRQARAETTLSPRSLDAVLAAFAPEVANGKAGLGTPRLAAPARVVAEVSPLTLAMKDYKPDLASLGEAVVNLTFPGRTVVEGLALAGAEGKPATTLGPVGLEEFKIVAKAHAGSLATSTGEPKPLVVEFGGRVLGGAPGTPGPGAATLASLRGSVWGSAVGTKPAGNVNAQLRLDPIESAALDRFLAPVLGADPGAMGMAAGALGEKAKIELDVGVQPPAEGGSWAAAPLEAMLNITAPRVQTNRPLKLASVPGRLVLSDATEVVIEADPAWVSSMMSGKGQNDGLTFEQLGSVTLRLDRLALARAVPGGPAVGPLKPGVFKLGAKLTAPRARVRLADGRRVEVRDVTADVRSLDTGGIDFELALGSTQLTDAAGNPQPATEGSGIKGSVVNLADASGNIDTKKAEISAVGRVPALPTALVDALANQGGMLTAALGPAIEADLRIDRFSLDPAKQGGTLAASAKSQRASASLRGAVGDRVFVLDGPLNVSVTEITKELSDKLVKGVPVVASIEKGLDLAPATVVGEGLRVPLNNDMSLLNGKVVLDPGELKIRTGGTFAKFLKLVKLDQEATIGRRLQPLELNITNGVANYKRYVLPLGEFKFESEGQVNLVADTIDVYTYIPFGALTDEAGRLFTGAVNNIPGIGQLVEAATLMPFRTSGPLSNPKTEPDVKRFAEEFVKRVRPDDLIKRGVGDLLKDVIKQPGAK